jgi:hypothetical protein
MTDLERFIDLYKQFGIDLTYYTNKEGNIEIKLSTYDSDKFDGYCDFHSIVEFTSDGKFIKQGFWE